VPSYTDKQIGDALKATRGMVYVAADRLGCSPNTIKARMKKSKKLRDIKESYEGLLLDKGELQLDQLVMAGNLGAVKYLLSTKGKERGYVEKSVHEHSGPEGGPVTFRVVRD
jgi:hypothetical protein